jgi:hypothetical protein
LIATRFYGPNPESLAAIDRWVTGALSVSDLVAVAVNVDADKAGTVDFLKQKFPKVTIIPVTPWYKFVFPLNAIVVAAAKANADQLLFTSTEFPASSAALAILQQHMTADDYTLVVGARLVEHDFRKGRIENANGLQVPWNTYALWKTRYLARFGFPLVGDYPYDITKAGVEELTAMALFQDIYPKTSCKLVDKVPNVSADKSTWDAQRHADNDKKMASKVTRPAEHLIELKMQGPTVIHI